MVGELLWISGRRLRSLRSTKAGFFTGLLQSFKTSNSKAENIALLEPSCSEFLIHAADAEGLQAGIDEKLVSHLADICTIPVTYAGGGRSIQDLELVEHLSNGKVDLTIGSALDIFGGKGVTFEECCRWNEKRR